MYSPEPIPDGVVMAPHHLYIGIMISWFWFMFVWKYYPRTGSLLTVLGVLIALDDAIQHAFQINTPLHYLWWGCVYPLVKIIESL